MNNFNYIEEKSLFQKCQCYGDIVEIQRFCYEPKYDEGFYLTFWSRGHSGKTLCWRERWRWIWNILRTGKPWADDVIINNRQAKEIVDYINKHLPKE